ncbi:MAG: thiamine biosynthesis protein ThiF [Alicyclobacillus sp. RIFOXYA1_FULL_53_8]|nr:MAG: thiamine biosynthesis protein ThiF [Alicyclobacillus sp. RIFOXYA1_FULL_53_8]
MKTFEHRYSRQILFRPIGNSGQARIRSAKVAIVGMGALGTVLATQLVRAGVGFVRLIDRDIIEASNLQRQSLYDETDAEQGLPKAVAAANKLQVANGEVRLEALVTDLTWRNAEELLADVDLIMDGTDNFQVRYLINDVAVKHGIAWAYGGAVSSYGTSGLFRPTETPCLVCLFGEDQGGGHDTCDTVGVIAPVVSVIASLQVAEALKYLTGNHDALSSGLTYIDVWNNEFRKIDFGARKENCSCCVQREFKSLRSQSDSLTVSFCGRRTIQVRPAVRPMFTLAQIAQRLESAGEVRFNAHLLRCDLGETQITLFADGRALIHGVDEEAAARSLYARYVGM